MTVLNVVVIGALCSWFIVTRGWNLRIAMVAAETPSQAPDCTSVLETVGDCLQFVTGQSLTPSTSCCSGVLYVHLNNPVCLCEFAVDSNITKAIPGYETELAAQLPDLCKIQGASVSECTALLGQVPENNATSTGGATSGPMPTSPVPGVAGGKGCKMTASRRYSAFICLGIAVAWSCVNSLD